MRRSLAAPSSAMAAAGPARPPPAPLWAGGTASGSPSPCSARSAAGSRSSSFSSSRARCSGSTSGRADRGAHSCRSALGAAPGGEPQGGLRAAASGVQGAHGFARREIGSSLEGTPPLSSGEKRLLQSFPEGKRLPALEPKPAPCCPLSGGHCHMEAAGPQPLGASEPSCCLLLPKLKEFVQFLGSAGLGCGAAVYWVVPRLGQVGRGECSRLWQWTTWQRAQQLICVLVARICLT